MTTTINGCRFRMLFQLSVDPLPGVTLSLNNSICENANPVILTGGSPAGGDYRGNGVLSGLFDPSISGPGVIPVTYLYTDGNGCSNCNYLFNHRKSIAGCYFSINDSVCENENPIVLSGGIPLGGVYTGNGVTSGIFDPSISGREIFLSLILIPTTMVAQILKHLL
ncbi:MAG: hypothetical protein IPG90_17990 [Bacteroidetes bacterium]|nr:hypothetical protein [Bacteroidota bacterium]